MDKIPNIIHYCWFGEKPLSKIAINNINSWKKFFPNYKIIQWNETNYNINKNSYISDAYKFKKYAFVSDYARYDVLYKYGGIYFDVDVQVIRSFNNIINNGAFMGTEYKKPHLVNPGLGFGATKNNILFRNILDFYDSQKFINDREYLINNNIVSYTNTILKKQGYDENSLLQKISNITIYPPEYFDSGSPFCSYVKITKNVYSIHHYTASWLNESNTQNMKLYKWNNLGIFLYHKKFEWLMKTKFFEILKNIYLNGFITSIKESRKFHCSFLKLFFMLI